MKGKEFVSALLADSGEFIVQHNVDTRWFTPNEKKIFEFVAGFYQKHGKFPKRNTVQKRFAEELPTVNEPLSYYYEELKNRYLHIKLKKVLQTLKNNLVDVDKTPTEALTSLQQEVMSLALNNTHQNSILDFTDDGFDVIVDELKKKLELGAAYGVGMGWDYLDSLTGGLLGGDFVSIIGKPAMGKTWSVLWSAMQAYNQNQRVVVVSMEMKPLLIAQRLASMFASIPVTTLKTAEISKSQYLKLEKSFKGLHKNKRPFWIVDGNFQATTEDIYILCNMLKPDVCFIDGAYLVRPQNAKMQTWERHKEVVEFLKQRVASNLNMPVIASYQFNREGAKKSDKAKNKADMLQYIGMTEAISQVSSIALGLFQDEGIETLQRREVTILKGRSGETGSFKIKWDFHKMDFSEWKEEDLQGLTSI